MQYNIDGAGYQRGFRVFPGTGKMALGMGKAAVVSPALNETQVSRCSSIKNMKAKFDSSLLLDFKLLA